MRSTNSHFVTRARQVILALCISISLSAQTTDRDLFDAYLREDMTVWQSYVDSIYNLQSTTCNHTLAYEYGYCGYIVAEAKKSGDEALMAQAKQYVRNFKNHIETDKDHLPVGHYEMYRSAVLVYELRLHESIHPFKAMSLAKEATRLAPDDPVILSYYGTCLFYAPKPFGSKAEALNWFLQAEPLFQAPQYQYSWIKEANTMYINQCRDKLSR